MSIGGGYARLYRKSLRSAMWPDSKLWKCWTWCLMKAAHSDRWVTIKCGRGRQTIKVKRGQFLYGRKSASKQLGMPEGTVRARMAKLVSLEGITIKATKRYSIVTVCNYDAYNKPSKRDQPSKQPTVDQPLANREPTDSQVNANRTPHISTLKHSIAPIEKKMAAPRAPFAPPSLDEVAAYCTERKNKVDPRQFLDHYTANGWKQGRGKPIVCWRAAVRTWERNNFSNGTPQPRKPHYDPMRRFREATP